MARILTGLVAGLLFGVGLAVSEMINPAKVLNFLDIFGAWDPSLAFVMLGAVVTAAIGYRLVLRRERPLFEAAFTLPTRQDIDAKLLAGGAIFGIGWGLGGYCPGPAISGLAFGAIETIVFVAAMAAGMTAWRMMSTMAPRPGGGEDRKWTTQRS
jgi:uncharacterized protein